MRFFLASAVVFLVSGCASPFSQPNKLQHSTPTPFQGSTVTMRPKLEPIEPGPTATTIAADKIFAVDAQDRSISDTLGRWALQNRLLLGWFANYDYPITPAMRAISAPNFNSALSSIRTALRSVSRPLLISVSGQTLTIRPGEARPAAAAPLAALSSIPKQAQTPLPGEFALPGNQPTQQEAPAMPAVSHGKRGTEPAQSIEQEKQEVATPWVVNPGDALLSASLSRWAALAKVKIIWTAEIDFPVTVKKPRAYAGSLSEAVGAVLKEVSKNGASLTHVLVGNELTIKESGT